VISAPTLDKITGFDTVADPSRAALTVHDKRQHQRRSSGPMVDTVRWN